MQLHMARLCLNCEEVHDQPTCPVCSSESFAYISRWIPAPERRAHPRQLPSRETADTYRQLLDANRQTSGAMRWVRRGLLGLTAVGIAGWAWGGKRPAAEADLIGDSSSAIGASREQLLKKRNADL